MSRKDDMKSDLYAQLSQATRTVIDGFGEAEVISPEVVSDAVYQEMDPEGESPAPVAFGFSLEIRQIARGILRRSFDPVKRAETLQGDAFS